MPTWILFTLIAAFTQNFRFMLQKHLRATGLSTAGATFARFLWAAPLSGIALLLVLAQGGGDVPALNAASLAYGAVGGLAQILATMCVVALFTSRNFTVGITLKKTETLLTALIGFVLLGDVVSGYGLFAILVGVIGVILISDPPEADAKTPLRARVFNRASGLGLLAGALFGVSATCYRGAQLALSAEFNLIVTLFVLMLVTSFQSVVMFIYLRWREPGEPMRVLRHWRVTLMVGATGILGSFFWFAAFTLQNPAYVKAVGQVELLFTFLASYLFFKERAHRREIIGIVLVTASILLIIL